MFHSIFLHISIAFVMNSVYQPQQKNISCQEIFLELLSCLEIIDRTDHLHNFHCRRHIGNNALHWLISHGALIQSVLTDRGSVDAIHLLGISLHREVLPGCTAAEQATCAMRSRAVPLGVALADAKKTAVTHVDGDQQLLVLLCGNCTLADDIGLVVDVVVYRLESVEGIQSTAQEVHQYPVGNDPAVHDSILLTDLHVVQISRPGLSGQIAKVSGNLVLYFHTEIL